MNSVNRKRVSYRDATVKALKKDYPEVSVRKGRDPYSFSITADKLEFKSGWEWCDFYEEIGLIHARFLFTCRAGKLKIYVSNFKGFNN